VLARVVAVALIASFAALLTAHVSIVATLLRREPRWRGLVALPVAPLAMYWALRERMYVRGVLWLLGFTVYVSALLIGYRLPAQ
jgi:sugar phosphate permease